MNKWWQKSVAYEIYVRSFNDTNHDGIGDLGGIIEKLDYLKDLGVDVLWLTPIYDSPNDDNGYDISNYEAIMDCFGTMADFKNLLDQAHQRGLKIIMDLVVNHTSDEHPWFIESKKGKNNPYRDYYIWQDPRPDGSAPNNWTSCFLGSAWQYDKESNQYYLHLFSKKQPDLNWDNPTLRNTIQNMMRTWLDMGIDGFRMDVITLISKDKANIYQDSPIKGHSVCANGPKIHEYLQELNTNVFSHYDCMTVGEAPAVRPDDALRYASNDGQELSMVFQFELMDVDGGEKMKWNDEKYNLVDVKAILRKWQLALHGKAWNSLFWNNHDQPRVVSRFGDTSTKDYWQKSAKMLATAQYFLEGTPYLFQGEELGMTNMNFKAIDELRDIESINAYDLYVNTEKRFSSAEMMRYINKASRDHARTPMQWDNSQNAGFSDVEPWIKVNPNYVWLNAQNQINDPHSIYHYYQKMIAILKENEVVQYGDYQEYFDDSDQVYIYQRQYHGHTLYVLCNFKEPTFTFDASFIDKEAKVILANYDNPTRGILRAYEAVVFYK